MRNGFLRKILLGAGAVALLTACGPRADEPGPTPTESTGSFVRVDTPPAGQLPEGVAPTAYRLHLDTDPAADRFSGRVEIDVALDLPHTVIWLHALGQNVTEAKAVLPDGTEMVAGFEQDLAPGGVSKLTFETPLPAGSATLVMEYDAPYNFGLAGLYKASSGETPYLATQMEPIDARRMLPSFDEPRFKTPWTLTVSAPDGNRVITNAPLEQQTALDNGWVRYEFATTREIQSYLVALAVGPYDEVEGAAIPVNEVRTRPVPLRAYAAAGKGEQLADALQSTYELLAIQERYFDYPYPYAKLDLIAAPDFAYGAMENAGAIIYRESALLMSERTSLAQRRGILSTHAHELAHQWFGNLVTPKWWDDIWLNEAFATWMSYKTMHAYDPDGGFDRTAIQRGIGAMGADSLSSARQIRNPIKANGDILGAFDGITYSKGGHVLTMFESYLGEDAFREGMRLHMRRFEDGVADVNDFMTSLADGSGNAEVVDSFKSFIFQPGIPFLNVTLSCPAGEAPSVTVTQSRYAPLGSSIDTNETWQVPFSMTVGRGNRSEAVTELLTERASAIALEGPCPTYIMPNAGGAGYWRFTTDDENWTALADNFDELSGGEQMMFADSLGAAFSAGKVSAEAMLAGLAATPGGEWDAAGIPLGRLSGLIGILDEADQPLMRAQIGDTYRPIYEDLLARDDLSQGETLFRQQLYRTMVNTVQDSTLRADIKARADAYIGLGDAEPNPRALPPAEFGTGIRVGIEDGDSAFFATALDLAKASQNQRERRAILNTLAGAGELADVTALLDTALGGEFQGQEALFMYFSALGHDDEAVQDVAWARFKADFDELVTLVPEIRKPQMAGVAGAFCDDAKTEEAATFIQSKADLIEGFERPLAQAVERARLCSAFRAAKANELAAALR